MHNPALLSHESLLEHESFVLALARGLLRDENAARDVAQETWIAAIANPPHAESARSWFARVTQRNALNFLRGERRRGERERAVARPERHESEPSAAQRLELQHAVVTAVLALDEPSRSLVIAVYYEGRTPNEIAKERGVGASTVRSQLSRALDKLRAELDRKHGSREQWFAALAGFARNFAPGAASTGIAASAPAAAAPVVLWTGVAAAAAATVVIAWQMRAPVREQAGVELAIARPVEARQASSIDPAKSADASTAEVAAPSSARTAVAETAADANVRDDMPAMLLRTRQIKQVLLDRGLTPEPDVVSAFTWLTQLPDAGVTRVLDRAQFGFECDLPWLDGGGAYFSFSERSHDYQTRPQIELQGTRLSSGFSGAGIGFVVDLGQLGFRTLAIQPNAVPALLDARLQSAWTLLQREVDTLDPSASSKLMQEFGELGFEPSSNARVGHDYLVRAISPRDFDVLAAFHVARVGDDGITIAWRLFESRPVANERGLYAWPEKPASIEPIPGELLSLDDPQLRAQLEDLRARGTKVLLDTLPPELAQRASELAGRTDAGIARLLDGAKPWTEFPKMRTGGAYFSFATRSHSYDEEPDVALAGESLRSGFAGMNTGWFVELGDVALDAVAPEPAGNASAKLRWLYELAFPYDSPHDEWTRAIQGAYLDASRLELPRTANAKFGTTWLLRTIDVDHHDLLVALRVVAKDDYGCFLEWRIVKRWPMPQK